MIIPERPYIPTTAWHQSLTTIPHYNFEQESPGVYRKYIAWDLHDGENFVATGLWQPCGASFQWPPEER